MWIVRLALRRPYTFVVMAVLIAILGATAIVTMPVDIFPYIDIPIVSVVWPYYGLAPEEMEKRVVTNFERNLTSGVNDIEHIESQSYKDIAVVRVYFHPNVKIDMAVAQVTAQMQSSMRNMPPGMFPANVLKYDAGSVPIIIDGKPVDLHISIGIALSPDHADDIDSLRRAADQAMYTAKRRGGSMLAFADED